jgi:tetratricopeptide (TPR) repeat protein
MEPPRKPGRIKLREQALALARDEGDAWNLAMALGNLAGSLLKVEDLARARALFDESLALYRAVGEPEGIGFALWGLGMTALGEGDRRRASTLLEESLELARKANTVSGVARCLADLGIVALHDGDFLRAAAFFEESLTLALRSEEQLLFGECLWGLAAVKAAQAQPARATRLWGAAAALHYASHLPAFATRPIEERLLASSRTRLGPDVFHAEWIKGQTMRREDAVAEALGHD